MSDTLPGAFPGDIDERACSFDCDGEQLVGIVSLPAAGAVGTAATTGILILVGGDQYRSGSHRQFTLLARAFAAAGVTTLRFDVRGMGDSAGAARPFDAQQRDIGCAIDQLMQAQPGMSGVVLWGLCDGATSGLLMAADDHRIKALVLANPWARTEAGQAQAYLRHYYGARLLSGDFWKKLLSGRFRPGAALRSLATQFTRARSAGSHETGLPERMLQAATRFHGPVLTILSGQDLTAREFDDLAASGSQWTTLRAGPAYTRLDLPEANHTFSTRTARQQVIDATLAWMRATLP